MTSHTGRCCPFFHVTFNAPPHLERCCLFSSFHRFDVAMALCTVNPRLHVSLVGKPHKVRHVMNLGPFDCFIFVVFLGKEFDWVSIRCCKFVATHTSIHGWYTSGYRSPSPRMAVLTGYFHLPCVELVREVDGLVRVITYVVHSITGSPPVRPKLFTLTTTNGNGNQCDKCDPLCKET